MADQPVHFRPLDPGRIDLQDQEELDYWAKEFACTTPELLDALQQVGNHVTAVRDFIHARRAHHARPRRG